MTTIRKLLTKAAVIFLAVVVAAVGFLAGSAPVAYADNSPWNTFLGGSGDDYGNAIAVDGSGNVYVAGYSAAT